MRDRSEAGENLPFPRELFDRWREYLDKSLATIDPREEAGHRDYIRSLAVLSRA